VPVTTEIVARAVIRREDRILVACPVGEDWCFLPGGHVEPGESVESALLRELAEELGTEASIVRLVGVVEKLRRSGARITSSTSFSRLASLTPIPAAERRI
jgi:ADP-ribose pyrophosphatase YjhB (NUDIX family)